MQCGLIQSMANVTKILIRFKYVAMFLSTCNHIWPPYLKLLMYMSKWLACIVGGGRMAMKWKGGK